MDIDNTQGQRLKTEALLRCLAGVAAAVVVLNSLARVGFHPFILITVCLLFFYLGISYYFLVKDNLTHQGHQIIITVDAIILAGTVTFVNFTPLPSAMLFLAYVVTLFGYAAAHRYRNIMVFLAACGLWHLFLPFTVVLSEASIFVISLMAGFYVFVISHL